MLNATFFWGGRRMLLPKLRKEFIGLVNIFFPSSFCLILIFFFRKHRPKVVPAFAENKREHNLMLDNLNHLNMRCLENVVLFYWRIEWSTVNCTYSGTL
jgi:hypothetical protein